MRLDINLPVSLVFWQEPKIRTYLNASSAAHKLFIGKYKPQLDIAVFKLCVKPGMTVLDIGANIGMYSVLAGRLVGEKGCVYAFEPTQKTFQYLKDNLRLNKIKNVHPICAAVSDRNGSGRFVEHQYSQEQNYLAPTETVHGTPVDMVRLDSFFSEHGITKIGFAKIDVEGAELLVLQSLGDALSKIGSLYIEFHSANYARYGYTKRDVQRFLQERGFSLYQPTLEGNEVSLAPMEQDQEELGDCNIVACR